MEFKKIAITGHTSGIGKGLYNYFVNKGCTVDGFSRSNGFDISIDDNLEKIVYLTKDCDLFINNAYAGYQQVKLAKLWQQQHWDDYHFILNVSSVASEPLANLSEVMPWLLKYGEEKYSLNKVNWEINDTGSVCKSIVALPGVVDTNFSNPYDTDLNNGDELFNYINQSNSIITVEDFVKTVDLVLQSINGRNFISSFTVLNGG